MPKGAKKRAKLKKQQQEATPAGSDDGGNNNHATTTTTATENGSNNGRGTASDGNHLSMPSNVRNVDVSEEDSMEDSEEMVTPRAGASEPDEEERKAAAAASEVPVEVVEAGEDVMVDALQPDASEQEQQGKVGAKQPEEALVAVQEPEVKRERVMVTKVHPVVHEPEPVEVLVVETPAASAAQEPAAAAAKDDVQVVVTETAVVQEQEAKGGDDAVGKDVPEVSRSRGAAVTTEVARGPAVAVAATGQRTKWWNCCGILDAFGSER